MLKPDLVLSNYVLREHLSMLSIVHWYSNTSCILTILMKFYYGQ